MPKKAKSAVEKTKDSMMNVKFPEEDYIELQKIAKGQTGGMSLSSMMRALVYAQLEKVRKSGDPREFLDMLWKKK